MDGSVLGELEGWYTPMTAVVLVMRAGPVPGEGRGCRFTDRIPMIALSVALIRIHLPSLLPQRTQHSTLSTALTQKIQVTTFL